MPEIQLKLYISGNNLRSRSTVSNLRQVLDEVTGGGYRLKVCDVLAEPQLAEKDKVMATPTLIFESPPMEQRIVGDLSDRVKLISYLGAVSWAGSVGKKADHGKE